MEPQLRLKDGTIIPLSDEVYEIVLRIVQSQEEMQPTASLEALEAEFADLFTDDMPSTDDLLEEHRLEREREERKLQRFR